MTLALAGCGNSTSAPESSQAADTNLPSAVAEAKASGASVDPAIVTANNGLGLSLLNLLLPNTTGNVALSPMSIALALDMVYNGAAGSTQQGMSQALELQSFSSALEVDTANAALQAAFIDVDPDVQIKVANSLWMHLKNNPVLPSFIDTNETYYGAEIGDLSGAPANVNAWISAQTNGLIPQMLNPNGNYSALIALIANAIYFKGAWTTAFDPSQTISASFTLTDRAQTTCEMMHQNGQFDYYQGSNFQLLRLPYGQQRLSMIIILPASGVSLTSFVSGLTVDDLEAWISELAPTLSMSIGLPRFTATYSSHPANGPSTLTPALSSLGMAIAFDPNQADFSGLAPDVYLSDVAHDTVVEVDETGTTAAAATVVGAAPTVVGPGVTMIMDRPFFYAIRDDKTGALLFVGVLEDPT
jgi:serine protease inhibitor